MSEQPVFNDNVQLITYVDRLGGGGFRELAELLDGLFGGEHLLPFYDPIDGADAGFDTFELLPSAASVLEIRRRHEDAVAELAVNLEDHSFVLRSRRDGETREARTFDELCTLLE